MSKEKTQEQKKAERINAIRKSLAKHEGYERRWSEQKADRIQAIRKSLIEYEETEKHQSEVRGLLSRQSYFKAGLIYGLILGILGNLVVQFFYPAFEHALLGNYNIVFWVNLVVSASALAIILYKTRDYMQKKKVEEHLMDFLVEHHAKVRYITRDLRRLLAEETEESSIMV